MIDEKQTVKLCDERFQSLRRELREIKWVVRLIAGGVLALAMSGAADGGIPVNPLEMIAPAALAAVHGEEGAP